MPDHAVAVHTRITGRVQGVGFRWWTQTEAERLGLSGWVRNEPDGAVAAAFRGPHEAIERMIEVLAKGPPGALVTGVATTPAVAAQIPQGGFRILR